MRTIWKFPLEFAEMQSGEDGDYLEIAMPGNSKIISIALQYETPCLWALVRSDNPRCRRRIRVIGTGHDIKGVLGEPIGSVVLAQGSLVLHFFDLGEFTTLEDAGGEKTRWRHA